MVELKVVKMAVMMVDVKVDLKVDTMAAMMVETTAVLMAVKTVA